MMTFSPAHANDFVALSNNQPQRIQSNASIQIVNFWATWCAPCRKEMPTISKWYQTKGKKQKVQLIGISLDNDANKVKQFLRSTPVSYPIWRYTGNNSHAMMKSFGNTIGAVPFTVIRFPKCNVQQALWGELNVAILDKAIANAKTKCPSK